MNRSDEIKNIAAALAKAQAEFGKVVKGKTAQVQGVSKSGKAYNHSYSYADLATVCEAVIPVLSKHGISVIQGSAPDALDKLETLLIHGESGEWISTSAPIFNGQNGGAQGYGSGVTYARRYALLAAVGVAPEDDDDGAKASGPDANMSKSGASNGAMISAEQYSTLRDLIEETSTNEAAFLKYYGAERLEYFPAAKFASAKAKLESKKSPAKETEDATA